MLRYLQVIQSFLFYTGQDRPPASSPASHRAMLQRRALQPCPCWSCRNNRLSFIILDANVKHSEPQFLFRLIYTSFPEAIFLSPSAKILIFSSKSSLSHNAGSKWKQLIFCCFWWWCFSPLPMALLVVVSRLPGLCIAELVYRCLIFITSCYINICSFVISPSSWGFGACLLLLSLIILP